MMRMLSKFTSARLLTVHVAWLTAAISPSISLSARGADTIDDAVKAIQAVGTEGAGFDKAIPAAQQLQKLAPTEIPRILDGAIDANPIVANWIRGIVFGIAEKSGAPPVEAMKAYVGDLSKNPVGRGLAMELIRQQDPDLAQTMIEQGLNDSSLAIREMAVEQAIVAAAAIEKSDAAGAIQRYRAALDAARHPRQLARVVEALTKLGETVSTSEAFALITKWQSVAPFDNVGGVGFDSTYPPEQQFAATKSINLSDTYPGKAGNVQWQAVEGSATEGKVDLAAAFNKEKGAVAYLYAEFHSPNDQPAQARLGCTNANKVWLNGKEVMSNEVYHSGNMIDQYIAPVELKQGVNRILLKICQNEQEEPWAQEWDFQFRLTDPTGKGLTSQP